MAITKGAEATVKVLILLASCSWSRFTKLGCITEITANSVLMAPTTMMASMGTGLPSIIASDKGSQLVKLQEVQGNPDLDSMTDLEYNALKNQLTRRGVILRSTTALSPWKLGKVERMVGVMKQAINIHGLHNSTFLEFVQLIQKVETVINSCPLGGYHGIMGTTVLRTVDLVFPVTAQVQVNLVSELPRVGKEADRLGRMLSIYKTFQELWSSLYLHDIRKFNIKQFGRHKLEENDFVIVLDCATSNHEFQCGLITKKT